MSYCTENHNECSGTKRSSSKSLEGYDEMAYYHDELFH